jgi:hypothetical protein
MLHFKSPSKAKADVTDIGLQKGIKGMIYFPVLLVDIGELQVYHFQTEEEYRSKKPFSECFWRVKSGTEAHGPFNTVFEACNHYKWVLECRKLKNNVIRVDFRNKRRV